jgi:hypothetical protein
MAPIKPKKTEAERFKSRMTEYCVFPLPARLTYRGATEELVIQEGLTVLCDGQLMDLFEYIKEYIRFYNWNEETESELESEPLTAEMAMKLLTVAYYDWADYSLWDMYTRFPLYMAYASYSEEQWDCRDRLHGVPPHSFPYWGKRVTLQENRLFAVDTYSDLTGAAVIRHIRGKTVSERGAHRRLFPSKP